MLTRTNRTILMVSQHNMERCLIPSVPIKTQIGAACIQQGTIEEHTGHTNLKAIVLTQEGEEKKAVVRSKKGKQLVCFNPKCKGKDDNHFGHNYPIANDKEKKEIITVMHKKWNEENQARKKVIPGQAYL